MGLFSNFFDRFKAADFHLAPNKKIKSIQAEFKNNFGLTLRVYKGKALADPEMTFAQLNQRTSKEINAANSDLEIKTKIFIILILQHYLKKQWLGYDLFVDCTSRFLN